MFFCIFVLVKQKSLNQNVMKKITYFLFAALTSVIIFSSCKDEDKDTTPPLVPTVAEIKAGAVKISGTGEPGTIVTVTVNNAVYTGAVSDGGDWFIDIPAPGIPAGASITVTLTDEAGNVSEAYTITAPAVIPTPAKPTLEGVAVGALAVKGTGEAGATVNVKIGTNTYNAIVGADGKWSVTIPAAVKGNVISATQTSIAGKTSEASTTTVNDSGVVEEADITPPAKPVITTNKIDLDTTTIYGTGEAKANVILRVGSATYQGTVGTDGKFAVKMGTAKIKGNEEIKVTLKDAASNESEAATYQVPAIVGNWKGFTSNCILTYKNASGNQNKPITDFESVIVTLTNGKKAIQTPVQPANLSLKYEGTYELNNGILTITYTTESRYYYGTWQPAQAIPLGDEIQKFTQTFNADKSQVTLLMNNVTDINNSYIFSLITDAYPGSSTPNYAFTLKYNR